MDDRTGMPQRRLRNLSVHWGAQVRRHLALVPVFDPGYKVLGMVGLDAETPPAWYPGTPLIVEQRRLVFKSSLSDASPRWDEVPPELLVNSCFLDPWSAIQTLVPRIAGAPSLAGSINLAECLVRGERVVDVIYEPSLHRVRALQLRKGWRRAHRVAVLRMPPLPQVVRRAAVPPLTVSALGAPPEGPETWLERTLRTMTQYGPRRTGRR